MIWKNTKKDFSSAVIGMHWLMVLLLVAVYACMELRGWAPKGSALPSPPNIAGEMFKFSTGIDLLHVPFKGVGPALAEVAAGRVDLMFTSYASALPFLQANKVDSMAVTTATRAKQIPKLPTLLELGYKDMVTSTWVGLIAPNDAPAPIVSRLNAMLARVMADPANVSLLLEHGFEARAGTPAEFGKVIATDTARNSQIVQRAGIKPE